jgi:hypothetical protein
MSTCVVFVCNKPYFDKFVDTCSLLVTNGRYSGDICLVIGDDLLDDSLLNHSVITSNNIHIKHFPYITFPKSWIDVNTSLTTTDGRNLTKTFQWHKLHLFNTWFRKWDFIFYVDCGMTIFSDISPLLNSKKEGKFLAHSDAFPTYVWKLHTQFEHMDPYYAEMRSKYNMDIDYCQTGIMLFDTNIIKDDTFSNLLELALTYPISRANEQGIIALYFTNIIPVWEQITIGNTETRFYDAMTRGPEYKYIMLKWT